MYNFDELIDRTNTNSYKWDKYSPDVLPLWVADMDFKAAPPILDALQRLVSHGVIGYSNVPKELNDAVVERLKNRHNWHIQKEWIVWLPGMIPGLHTSTRLLGNDNVGVMTTTPVYHPFLHAAEWDKHQLQGVPFVWQNNRWEMDFEGMEKAITSTTKMYMLCNPHNPNGRVFSREELEKLANFCLKNDLLLCSDEIHCELILDETKKHISIATLNEEIEARTITLLAPSKTFNIAGLGCTMAIIPDEKLREKFEYTRLGMMPPLTAYACESALAAYTLCDDWHTEVLAYLRGNHDFLLKEINQIKGLSMQPIEATYLAWIDYRQTDNENFVQHLEKFGVGVQDAAVFGGKGFFRLNFATQRSRLEEAIKRMKEAVA